MDNRPIGVFDSGLGGLTAVKALRRLLPGEDLIYFGDTARGAIRRTFPGDPFEICPSGHRLSPVL